MIDQDNKENKKVLPPSKILDIHMYLKGFTYATAVITIWYDVMTLIMLMAYVYNLCVVEIYFKLKMFNKKMQL